MLQSFGLVRSNALKEFVYRRPLYFAMQNVYSVFDDDMVPQSRSAAKLAGREVSFANFSRFGKSWHFCWFSDRMPDSALAFTPVDIELSGSIDCPVWIDMITGRVFEIPAASAVRNGNGMLLKNVPLWDSPVAITSHDAVAVKGK